jgi:hypothetical protein
MSILRLEKQAKDFTGQDRVLPSKGLERTINPVIL